MLRLTGLHRFLPNESQIKNEGRHPGCGSPLNKIAKAAKYLKYGYWGGGSGERMAGKVYEDDND